MMYAASDIHRCWDKYKKLLKKIHFGSDDALYILGDVIDCGCAFSGRLGFLCLDTMEEIYV